VRDGGRQHAFQVETPDVCRVSSGFDVGSSVFEQAHRRIPSRQYLSALLDSWQGSDDLRHTPKVPLRTFGATAPHPQSR